MYVCVGGGAVMCGVIGAVSLTCNNIMYLTTAGTCSGVQQLGMVGKWSLMSLR